MFECKRCGYIAKSKGNYKLHIFKQKPCDAYLSFTTIEEIRSQFEKENVKISSYTCTHCGKSLSSRQTKSVHMKSCKHKSESDQLITITKTDLDHIIQQHVQKILCLHQDGIYTVNSNNTINNNQTINNITVNVNIRDFEDEAGLDSHVTTSFKLGCMLEKNIPKLIKEVFCNDARPENHCVRLKNKKQKIFEVVKDGKWVNQGGDETLIDLINKGYRILRHLWLWETKDMVDRVLRENDCYKEVKHWFDRVCEDDPRLYKEMKEKTFLIFVDQKEGRLAVLSR